MASKKSSMRMPVARKSSVKLPAARESVRSFRSSFPDATGFRTGAWRGGTPSAGEKLEVLHSTTLEALAVAAKHGGKAGVTLYFDDEDRPAEHKTFAEIQRLVHRAAQSLASRGVLAGDRVLLVLPTSFEFIISFFAVQRISAIPVPS